MSGSDPSGDGLLRRGAQRLAADAVATAAFNEKKWLWVPDPTEGYVAAYVVKESADDNITVKGTDEKERNVNINDTQKMNPPKFDKVEDMADLAYLNEASVVHNLRIRYHSNLIYTYSGLFLVAVNPYHKLPIYSDQVVQSYKSKKRMEMPPHVYAVADAAYREMLQDRENQSMLITGESGAGKTENTKKVIQYLASIAATPEEVPNKRGGTLEQQILQANPILESFGNAQTIRNNNSSRFGKFIRIEFNSGGVISGANIEKYLLEKSRVTHQTAKERNYHIFYQLLKGAGADLKKKLLLDGSLNDYVFTKSSNKNIDGVDDSADFKALKESMEIMGLAPEEHLDFFRIISAVLLLGNISSTPDRENQAEINDPIACEKVCHVMSLPVQEFMKALLKPKIRAGRDWVTQSRTPEQVTSSLEALARSLYERMFSRLVDRVNAALDIPASRSTFIGVLDIAGFEIFDVNSFEQLCINYTNERLQQFFNHHMFILEQEEYKREGIEWKFIDFGLDLQPTIDLIEKTNPIGILSCLDEECVMPKATDKTFADKLHSLWKGKSSKYEVPRFQDGFMINHYAGKVEYRTGGWLDKNRDPLNENLTKLLANSGDKFVGSLFSDYMGENDERTSIVKVSVVKKGAFRTVAQKHKEQLISLMNQLYSTQPHFVRCIIPNDEKKPGKINLIMVLDQLRCNGVLEGIRICRAGFPNRLPFAEFRQRYEILCSGLIPKGFMDGRKATQTILEALNLDANQYRIGSSKVFFRAGVLAELEEIRDTRLSKIMTTFQAQCRGFLCRKLHRKRIDQVKAIKIVQRNARIYVQLREWAWWKLYAKVKPLLNVSRVDDELRRKEDNLNELKAQMGHHQEERDKLESRCFALEADKKHYEELLKTEQSAAADQAVILSRTRERLAALQDELDRFNKEYADLEKAHDDNQVAKVQLEVALKDANETVSETQQSLAALEKEKTAKEAQLKQLDDDLKTSTAALSKAEVERNNLAQIVADYEKQVSSGFEKEADLLKQKRKLESHVKDLDERVLKQEQELQLTNSKKSSVEAELNAIQSQVQDLQKALHDMEVTVRKKEDELSNLGTQLKVEANAREASEKQARDLQAKISNLEQQLESEIQDKDRIQKQRKKLEQEFEDLRHIVEDKNDQETKNSELRRLRESEIMDIKNQLQQLQQEYESAKRKNATILEGLRKECETLSNERDNINKQRLSLEKKLLEVQSELDETGEHKNRLDKAKRQLDADLASANSNIAELNDKISDLSSTKEALDRQLTTMTARAEETDARSMRLDSERVNLLKQLEGVREELEEEVRRRNAAEQSRKKLQEEMTDLLSRMEDKEASLNDVQRRLASKTQELETLKEKYGREVTTRTAEHDEARKKLEREIQDLRAKLANSEQQASTLEKAKSRLTADVEDLRLEVDREHAAARQAEKLQKQLESDMSALNSIVESERRQRESLETRCRTLQSSIESLQTQQEDQQQAYSALQRTKADLEAELKGLIHEIGDGGKNVHELEKAKKRLEDRVAELSSLLEDEESVRKQMEELRRRAEDQLNESRQRLEQEMQTKDAQYEETRKMYQREINDLGARLDEEIALKTDLLKAKKRLETELADLSSKEDSSLKSKNDLEKMRKKIEGQLRDVQTKLENEERARKNFEEMAQRHEKKAATLSTEVERLEQVVESLDREKKKNEKRIEELVTELEGGEGGSKASLLEAKRKMEKDIQRLREELEQEQELRQHLQTARRDESADVEGIRSKVKCEFEEKIEKLEESRRALMASLRISEQELDQRQRIIESLEKQKKNQLAEIEQLQERMEQEASARNEEMSSKRKLLADNKEMTSKLDMETAKCNELNDIITVLRNRADVAMTKLEGSDMARLKAEKAESTLKLQAKELEENLVEVSKDKKVIEEKLRALEAQMTELSARSEEDAAELTEAQAARRRLSHEMEEERERYKRDIEDREQQINSMRRKYSAQLKELSAELDIEKTNHMRQKEDLAALEQENSQLVIRLEDEQRAKIAAMKEKQRMETKVGDISRQYADAIASNDDYQSQITKLLAQIREARSQLMESEAQRVAFERSKRTLDARVEELSEQVVDLSKAKASSQSMVTTMEQELMNLRSALETAEDLAQTTQEKLSKVELTLQQANADVARYKDIATDSDRTRVNMEKQAKELTLRIMELESSTHGDGGRALTRFQAKIDELSAELERETREREDAARNARKAERTIKDLQLQLSEREKQKQRAEEELEKTDAKFKRAKAQVEEMETNDATMKLSKHRLERELQDAVERAGRLEAETKRLRARGV